MKSLPNLLLAGALLASAEIALVLARGSGLFLSLSERALYAVASLSAIGASVLLVGLAFAFSASRGDARRWGRLGLGVLFGGVAAQLLWSVSDGRRVRDLALRPLLVAVLALLVGGALYVLLSALAGARERLGARARRTLVALGATFCGGLLIADASILPRGYPAFHIGLQLLAVSTAALAALLAPPLLAQPSRRRAAGVLALAALICAPFALTRLGAHPTAGFAVREHAPWTARLLRPFTAAARAKVASAPAIASTSSAQGVDLRDRDVLLITVDALRADLLRAYGGSGATPELDRLAEESAVFTRAYTPAPHTSYALASLLTGKFVRPLVELGGKLGDPPTLPDRLRRYGYRTAAFYPPAVFFVDGASFEALAQRGFGFEYRKEMFASAAQRVEQLESYLAEADPKRPLFVWVHLFEPHEPYDPPADIAHDGTARGRYVAEVAACDRAIPALIARFRAARPKATVIVTADHGEEFGDHGGSFHGSTLYDEQVRVPLLWSSPGVVSPRRIDAPVELTDVGTTLLSTAAIPRDAHMRGDDLGPLLAGRAPPRALYAYASIDQRHMVTDGRMKAICGVREPHCALFDLVRDPGESRNLAGVQPHVSAALRGRLDAFLASIPQVEAQTVSAGVELPDALARAKLGAASAGEELVALLADPRPAVRREAARALGTYGALGAVDQLERARQHDEDADVRAEAAIALLRIAAPDQRRSRARGTAGVCRGRAGRTRGSAAPAPAFDEVEQERAEAVRDGVALLGQATGTPEQRARARLAAIALARWQRPEATPVLAALALDELALETERADALRALGESGSPEALAPLLAALDSVRLREAAAQALAVLGDVRAVEPLHAQFLTERYPPARRAELEALRCLGDPRVSALARRALGMESSLPEGLRLLADLGALTPASRTGALLADASVRRGEWRCTEAGCAPGQDAVLALPARGPRHPGTLRVVLGYRDADPGAVLTVDGERFPLHAGSGQLSFLRDASRPAERLTLSGEELSLFAIAVVPAVAELPPPAPEPWDAGAAQPEAADDAGAPPIEAGDTLPSR